MNKVGQIFKDKDNFRFVITLCSPLDIYIIYNNGSCHHLSKRHFRSLDYEFITDYPTWQEAVNSKEFNE